MIEITIPATANPRLLPVPFAHLDKPIQLKTKPTTAQGNVKYDVKIEHNASTKPAMLKPPDFGGIKPLSTTLLST